NIAKPAALAAEKARERNSADGSIGSGARRSHAANATSSAAPAVRAATTSPLPQPAALPRTSPHTSPSAAPVRASTPGTSSARRRAGALDAAGGDQPADRRRQRAGR